MITRSQRFLSAHKWLTHHTASFTRTPVSKTIDLPDRPVIIDGRIVDLHPVRLHYWEWAGNKPSVLFCHGVSFHSRCYDHIIEQAFPESHVISLDMRGHGQSEKHSPPYSSRWLGDDLEQFIRKLGLENIVGVGHSVGGYSMALAACKLAATADASNFRSLLLLDPVVFPREAYADNPSQAFKDMCVTFERYRRRKIQWTSVEDMMSSISRREPFSRWPRNVLRDYCTHGTDQQFRLLCSPDTEIAMYCSMVDKSGQIYDDIQQSKNLENIPVHVVRCSKPFAHPTSIESSLTAPTLAKHFAQGYDIVLDDTSHLFPMENPHLTADLVKSIVEMSDLNFQRTRQAVSN